MRQTKSQETQRGEEEGEEGREEERVSLHRETVPSLDTGESWCWKMLKKKKEIKKKKKTHIASQELVPAHFLPGVETFSEGEKEAEESRWSATTAGTWLIGTESTPSLTLIDQPLSEAKARVGGRAVGGGVCNKHSRSVDLEQTLQRTD